MIFMIFWSALLSAFSCFSQEDFKIYLVGDAGDHTVAGETLINLQQGIDQPSQQRGDIPWRQ